MTGQLFTPEQIKDDGTNRVARTNQQVSVPTAVVIVADWFAHQVGWHGTLPTAVSGALVVLLTTSAAQLMNRKRLRGEA